MSEKPNMAGHLAAAVTIFIWGTTFISTKVLLVSFTPLEILFFRFFIGYAALWIAAPRLLHTKDIKKELLFAAAGLCGVTLYFLAVHEGGKAGPPFLNRLHGGHAGNLPLKLSEGYRRPVESQRRFTGACGGNHLGGLLHSYEKNRNLWVRNH